MQVTLTHKGILLTHISMATTMRAMLQIMRMHADQLMVPVEEIEFEFTPTAEDALPFLSMVFIVGDNMVLGSVNTETMDLQREFGVVEEPYTDKNKIVNLMVSELSKATHIFGNLIKQGRLEPIKGEKDEQYSSAN